MTITFFYCETYDTFASSFFLSLFLLPLIAAFAVDPLYHQTSALFDEGGARGLLLNNLGIYGGCRVLFDSLEVPAKCSACSNLHDKEMIDISFAQGLFYLLTFIFHIPCLHYMGSYWYNLLSPDRMQQRDGFEHVKKV